MDILKLAAQLFMQHSNIKDVSTDGVIKAFQDLLGNQSGGIDLTSLIAKFGQQGLGNIVNSWLGDGANDKLSPTQLTDVLGKDKIAGFASQLGIDTKTASNGLAEALPKLIDKASSGGSLLSGDLLGKALGNLGGLGNLFK